MSIRNFSKSFFLTILLIFFLTSGFQCKVQTSAEREAMKPITLEYWGVFNESSSLAPILESYKTLHPNITVKYKKFRYEEYEEKLLDALAEDRGPDIFSIHNTWVNEYGAKLAPMPASVKIPFHEIKGSIKKEKIITIKTVPSISILKLKNDFIDAVYSDCVRIDKKQSSAESGEQVVCLPLSADTLGMFYNKDLLNAAGIALPPTTWQGFNESVKSITKYNAQNEIIQSAVGLGTSNNVDRFSDILALLMMQNGTEMARGNQVAFHMPVSKDYLPGLDALKFYTAFSRPGKEVYTWDKSMPSSLESFIQGKAAFFFGYSYHTPLIKAKSPKLNFGIAAVPQISNFDAGLKANVANYWTEAVSKKSKNIDVAWNFLQYSTTNPQIVSTFLNSVKRPAALRGLLDSQLQDELINPFASQILISKSWYKGKNSGAMETILAELIDSVETVSDDRDYQNALTFAARKIQETY